MQKWLLRVAPYRDEELSGQFALAAFTDCTTINKVFFYFPAKMQVECNTLIS